jgi:hypothetical protein
VIHKKEILFLIFWFMKEIGNDPRNLRAN